MFWKPQTILYLLLWFCKTKNGHRASTVTFRVMSKIFFYSNLIHCKGYRTIFKVIFHEILKLCVFFFCIFRLPLWIFINLWGFNFSVLWEYYWYIFNVKIVKQQAFKIKSYIASKNDNFHISYNTHFLLFTTY